MNSSIDSRNQLRISELDLFESNDYYARLFLCTRSLASMCTFSDNFNIPQII